MKLLTNLLFEPKGKHNSALSYNIKDTVMSADGSRVYFALQNVPAGIALTNEDYWMLQMDISSSKSAMDEALASFGNYAKSIGMRVKGETAKASGNPVSFLPDAGSLLQPVTVLEPKQAGSGDPYPAGGGRNLLPTTASTTTIRGLTHTVNSDGTIGVKGTSETENASFKIGEVILPAGDYIVSGAAGNSQLWVYENDTRIQTNDSRFSLTETTLVRCNLYVREGISYDIVISPMIRLASIADDTYTPCSNIRPFTGYDKLGLNVAGKNLIGPPVPLSYSLQNFEYDRETGAITIIKEGYAGSQAQLYFKLCDVPSSLIGKKCALSYGDWAIDQSGDSTRIYVMDQTGANIVNIWPAEEPYKNRTAVIPDGTTELRILIRIDQNNSYPVGTKLTISGLQVEIGDAATPFTPYSGVENHTVQLGQTVYGFRYEWLTGKGVIEWKAMRLLASWVTSGMKYVSGYVGVWMDRVLNNDLSEGQETILCSHLVGRAVYNWSRDGVYVQGGNTIGIQFSGASIPGYTDTGNADQNADLVRAYLEANEVWIAWKLATPIEIGPFTPHIISAADPEQTNTLYGDGRIEVEYVKPLHVSIEERVAAAMAAMHIE